MAKSGVKLSMVGRQLASTRQRIAYPVTPDLLPRIRAQIKDSPSPSSRSHAQMGHTSQGRAPAGDAMQTPVLPGATQHTGTMAGPRSRRREIAQLVASVVVFAVVAATLALVFGYSGRQSGGGSLGEATAAGDGVTPATSFVVPIIPEPGWDIQTTATGTITEGGDVLVRIEAEGPDSQLRLMWYVSTGSCHMTRHEVLRWTYPSQVLSRRNPDTSQPGYQTVTLLLEREWLTQPLTVGAFQNGEGQLVNCGDIPPLNAMTVPVASEPGWQLAATAKAWMAANGDVLVQIEARGSARELDLMWYVSTGSCRVEQDETLRSANPPEVLSRRNPEIRGDGFHAVTLVIERRWLSQPLAVGALQNGGGSLAVCGDLPVIDWTD